MDNAMLRTVAERIGRQDVVLAGPPEVPLFLLVQQIAVGRSLHAVHPTVSLEKILELDDDIGPIMQSSRGILLLDSIDEWDLDKLVPISRVLNSLRSCDIANPQIIGTLDTVNGDRAQALINAHALGIEAMEVICER